MKALYSSENLDIVDGQQQFSRHLCDRQCHVYSLRPGEFYVSEPYYTASKAQGKKRKRGDDDGQQASSQTDILTARYHVQVVRPFLTTCLAELSSLNFESFLSPEAKTPPPQNEEEDAVNFPSLIPLAEASLKWRVLDEADTCEINQDLTEMETLDVFHRIISNPDPKFCKTLQLEDRHRYLIPPKATFLMGDLSTSMDDLVSHAQKSGRFDLVVIDPPWPNKSAHRSSHYETQDIYDLFQIPMPRLLRPRSTSDDSQAGGMVAVWVTNKPKYHRFVTEKLFPSWGLKHAATWYWLKVTTAGEPVVPLDSPHRKPYEQLILGTSDTEFEIPKQRAIVSVPCRRHSRKPFLQDILEPYLPENPRCLEMFARCLMPNWTSWGNECLKFQNLQYFEKKRQGETAK